MRREVGLFKFMLSILDEQTTHFFNMNRQQSNKFNMYLTVRDILDDHIRDWSTVPILNDLKVEFDQVVLSIGDLSDEAKSNYFALPGKRDKARKRLADKTLIVSGALESYAAMIEDEILSGIVAISRMDLARARDIELEALIMPIIEEARARRFELVNFGITESVIRDLEMALGNYLSQAGIRELNTVRRQEDFLNLESLFIKGDYLLGVKMDKLMIQFKNPNPDFYDEYVCARIVVDN